MNSFILVIWDREKEAGISSSQGLTNQLVGDTVLMLLLSPLKGGY